MKFYRALFLFSLLFMQCHTPVDLEAEKARLLALHTAQQTAHLQKNAEQFVAQFSENMLMVNRGKISADSREKMKNKIQGYFDAVDFKRWEDLAPPRVFFSEDATMAYVLVDKSVILTRQNERKETVEESTHFAWVSIYQKQPDGNWKMTCNVSTNELPVEQVLSLPD